MDRVGLALARKVPRPATAATVVDRAADRAAEKPAHRGHDLAAKRVKQEGMADFRRIVAGGCGYSALPLPVGGARLAAKIGKYERTQGTQGAVRITTNTANGKA